MIPGPARVVSCCAPRTGAFQVARSAGIAARDGWSGCGFDAMSGQIRPAPIQADHLFEHVKAALHDYGDTEVVRSFLERLIARGGGAERQRATATRHAALTAVVDELVTQTAAAPRESISS